MKLIEASELIVDGEFDIKALFLLNEKEPIQVLVVTTDIWNKIINNENVKKMQGTALPLKTFDGVDHKHFVAVLQAIPWIHFCIKDDGTLPVGKIGLAPSEYLQAA
jgi:hypothetical protein